MTKFSQLAFVTVLLLTVGGTVRAAAQAGSVRRATMPRKPVQPRAGGHASGSNKVRDLTARAAREPLEVSLKTLEDAARIARKSRRTADLLAVARAANARGRARLFKGFPSPLTRRFFQLSVSLLEHLRPVTIELYDGFWGIAGSYDEVGKGEQRSVLDQ